MVDTLQRAGKNLTRASLLRAARRLDTTREPVPAARARGCARRPRTPSRSTRSTSTATTTGSGSAPPAPSPHDDLDPSPRREHHDEEHGHARPWSRSRRSPRSRSRPSPPPRTRRRSSRSSYAPGNVTHIVASAVGERRLDRPRGDRHPERERRSPRRPPRARRSAPRRRRSARSRSAARCCRSRATSSSRPRAPSTPASQAACTQGVTPQLTLLLVLQAAGQTINLPAYILPTSGAQTALGSAQLVFCLPPPDLPAAKGGATFGAKFLSADLTLNGVFGPVVQGAWVAFWTPWNAGVGTDQRRGDRRLPGGDRAGRDHAHRAARSRASSASPAGSRRAAQASRRA